MVLHLTSALKVLDIYREVPSDLTESTTAGAVATLLSMTIAIFLFCSEFALYLETETISHTFVDQPIAHDYFTSATMEIHMNISVPGLPCAIVSLDYQDVMGTHNVDVGSTLQKYRLDTHGTVKERFKAYRKLTHEELEEQKGEGCQLFGSIAVKRVPGNFHISAHAHREEMKFFFSRQNMNASHIVNHLSFGSQVSVTGATKMPAFSPLNGVRRIVPDNFVGSMPSFEYYIKVVPTISEELDGAMQRTFQFTANTNQVNYQFPAIYFRFDMSPISIQYTQRKKPFTHFLVQICAIIGGVVTVLGMISSIIHRSLRRIMKKANMGKLS